MGSCLCANSEKDNVQAIAEKFKGYVEAYSGQYFTIYEVSNWTQIRAKDGNFYFIKIRTGMSSFYQIKVKIKDSKAKGDNGELHKVTPQLNENDNLIVDEDESEAILKD